MTENDNIRINKVLKEFNIGMSTLVDFLRKKGVDIEANPNAKLTGAQYSLVAKEFKKEQIVKAESKKVAIKVKDITDKEPKAIEEKEPEKEPDVDIEKELNALIRSGASKSEVNNYLRQALNSGVITQSQYNSYKNTYAPRGNTY